MCLYSIASHQRERSGCLVTSTAEGPRDGAGRAGFMWFGTEDGLDRFDGYSFQHLRQTHDLSGLPDAAQPAGGAGAGAAHRRARAPVN